MTIKQGNTSATHSDEILDAMRIRQEIDAEINGLYQDRSLKECAGFLLPNLKIDNKLLDCGCGPGQLSSAFAKTLTTGTVDGIDANPEHVRQAKERSHSLGLTNTNFHNADIYHLPFDDNTFDVAFFHTVICNLHDPVRAIKEVKRVLKPGGIIAAREPDYNSSIIHPEDNDLLKGLEALGRVQVGYSDAATGRKLPDIFHQAGITDCKVSASCDTYSSKDQLEKISSYLKAQVLAKDVCESMLEKGLIDALGVSKFCQAFDNMTINPSALYLYTLIEVIGRKPL